MVRELKCGDGGWLDILRESISTELVPDAMLRSWEERGFFSWPVRKCLGGWMGNWGFGPGFLGPISINLFLRGGKNLGGQGSFSQRGGPKTIVLGGGKRAPKRGGEKNRASENPQGESPKGWGHREPNWRAGF